MPQKPATDVTAREVGPGPLTTEQVGVRLAASSVSAYVSGWRRWETWATDHGETPFPAGPAAVARFITERADAGRSLSTIDTDLAAIRHGHHTGGLDDPTSTLVVRRVRAQLHRKLPVGPRRPAYPLTTEDVTRIVAVIDPGTVRGARDAALILLGHPAGLRRSELAALNAADIQVGAAGVTLARRDQPAFELPSETATAVVSWLEVGGHREGDALFPKVSWLDRPVRSTRLTGQAIGQAVTARARAAGMGHLHVTTQSLRALSGTLR